jgi:hypothetical protein
MITLNQAIVVETLARVDALHEPIRSPQSEAWAATHVLRRRFSKRGLPWYGGGDFERERALHKLVAAGLLRRRKAVRKTVAVALTPAGFIAAWQLIGVSPDAALELTRLVHRLGTGGRWVRETSLTGGTGWGDGNSQALKEAVVLMRPALARQWVESNCDMYNRVGYRVTEAGSAALAGPVAAPDGGNGRRGPVAPPDLDAPEVYHAAYREMISWLDAQTALSVDARGEIGAIPLSTAEWKEQVHEPSAERGEACAESG